MSIAAYNEARDREAHAFDASPLGDQVRMLINLRIPAMASDWQATRDRTILACALMVAFTGSMPAFYALRSLRVA